MGGSTKQTEQQQSTSSNTIDPAELAMLQGNYSAAQGRAASLTPYTGQLTAGFTPTQLQSQGILSGVGTDPQYAANNATAITGAQGVLSGATGMNTNVNAQPVTPSTLAGTDLTPYMNPYTNDVVNTTIADQERAREIAGTADNQQATAAGAFGGSRSGVLNSLTNDAYDRNTGSLVAGLRSNNYGQAQAAALNDVNAQNNANQFNSTQNVNAQQSSINNKLAALGMQLNSVGQIVSLNNAALGTAATQGGILASVGDAQQQQQQTQLNNAYQAYTQGQQLTVEQQQLLNSALGLIPNQQTVNSTGSGTNTTSSTPGLGGILGGLGSLASGAGSAWTAFSDSRLKSDVRGIGSDNRGRSWYEYRYNWEPVGTVHQGVMAQEILHSDPDAVSIGDDGFYRVDYSKLSGLN